MGRQLTFAVDIDGTITENGGGRMHLGALACLRQLARSGHNVIFVSGRSSVEGYLLSVFAGTTQLAVGENGGCITQGPSEHAIFGDMQQCRQSLSALEGALDGVAEKPVFPRMTEVVLERTFEIGQARDILREAGHKTALTDSGYAYHINSAGIDKGAGMRSAMQMLSCDKEQVIAIGDSETDVPLFEAAGTSVALGNAPPGVRSKSTLSVSAGAGDGLLEAVDALGPRIAGGLA